MLTVLNQLDELPKNHLDKILLNSHLTTGDFSDLKQKFKSKIHRHVEKPICESCYPDGVDYDAECDD